MKEIIKDYGEWYCPTKWDDVTLKMFSDIERYYSEKDKEFDSREVLHILTNRSVDDINQLPIEFAEMLINKMQFLQTYPKEEKPTNKIVIDGEEYHINFQEKLKTGEYVAVDTVLKGDRHNYAAILAILCRKDDEIYDAKFENEVLPSRIELFEKQSITRVLPIMSFFFTLITDIRNTFPIVFSGGGTSKPHSAEYRNFAEDWGFSKTLFEMADGQIGKVAQIKQEYLNDTLTFLTYLIQKSEMEEREDKFQDQLRRAKRGGR